MGYKQFYNEDFALDAQKGIYKYDLGLSPFEYTYDSVVSSSGVLVLSKEESQTDNSLLLLFRICNSISCRYKEEGH